MRKASLRRVKPGTKLAKTIIDISGRLLLTAGTEIKESYISRLRNLGVSEIYIDDDISEGICVNDVIKETTRIEAKQVLSSIAKDSALSGTINSDSVKNVIDKMVDELLDNNDIIFNLSDIKTYDGYTFEHSVNVCILSIITGIGLGYNMNRIRELGVGALMHDIGKLKVPENILNKPAKLTSEEFEIIKKHTTDGFEILRKDKNISKVSAYIALAHHERYDGSGYPFHTKGDNIHQCARVVSVADVYDALTSDRIYRKKMKVHEAIEYIVASAGKHFDKDVVDAFISHIAIYPVGTGVVLNTGEKGLVVKVHKAAPSQPIVRVIYNEKKRS